MPHQGHTITLDNTPNVTMHLQQFVFAYFVGGLREQNLSFRKFF